MTPVDELLEICRRPYPYRAAMLRFDFATAAARTSDSNGVKSVLYVVRSGF